MFYAQQVLTRKGPLAKIWLAATFQTKLTRAQVFTTDVASACRQIATPEIPMALRLTGCLLLGVSRIYQKQTGYVLEDASEALAKLQLVYHGAEGRGPTGASLSGQGGGGGVLTSASTTAHYGSITFSESVVGAGPGTSEATRSRATGGEQRGSSALLLMGDYWHGLLGMDVPDMSAELIVGTSAGSSSAPATTRWPAAPQFRADTQRITINTSLADSAFETNPWAAEIVRQDWDTGAFRETTPLAGTPTMAPETRERSGYDQAPTPEQVRSVVPTLPEPPPLDLSLANIQPASAFPETNALNWSIASEEVPRTPLPHLGLDEHSVRLHEQTESLLNASTTHHRKRRKSTGRRTLGPVYQLDTHLELPANVIRRALADTSDTLRRVAVEEATSELDGTLKITDLVEKIVPTRGAPLHPHLQTCWSAVTRTISLTDRNQRHAGNAVETSDRIIPETHPVDAVQDSFTLDDSQFSFGIPTAELSRLSALSPAATPTQGSAPNRDSSKLERAMASPAHAERISASTTTEDAGTVPVTASTQRTDQMMSYLERKFQERPHPSRLSMHHLWREEAASRQVIVRSVLELLVLATQNRIVLEQTAPYEDVVIMLPEHISVSSL